MSLETVLDTGAFERIHGPTVRVDLEASLLLPGGREHACRIVEASTGEMAFATPLEPRYGDHVVVYVSELGRLEGDVERQTESGFAITLDLPERRRRRLAGQLIWFANRENCALSEARRHKRFVPRMPWTYVRMPDGKERVVQINDVSLTGVSVDAADKVAVGDRLAFGVKAAVVRRVFKGGFVAEFEEPFAEGEISETTRL
ncbi:PilZ domain-containing protein [Methylocystis sp. S23]|jgi:hypothetical protein